MAMERSVLDSLGNAGHSLAEAAQDYEEAFNPNTEADEAAARIVAFRKGLSDALEEIANALACAG